eukprot:910491-Pyramimonas_sp.AAC.1
MFSEQNADVLKQGNPSQTGSKSKTIAWGPLKVLRTLFGGHARTPRHCLKPHSTCTVSPGA